MHRKQKPKTSHWLGGHPGQDTTLKALTHKIQILQQQSNDTEERQGVEGRWLG